MRRALAALTAAMAALTAWDLSIAFLRYRAARASHRRLEDEYLRSRVAILPSEVLG